MPNMAAITKVRNLLADLDVEELVRRERAGERRERADHGLDDDVALSGVENMRVEELAQRAERDALGDARTPAPAPG